MPTTTKTAYETYETKILAVRCKHCGCEWIPHKGKLPKICPRCKYILTSEP